MLRSFEGAAPAIADSAFVDEMALVIGRVAIGEDSSVWPMAVIRGDSNSITIGNETSIQDGSVLHVNHDAGFNPGGDPLIIGDRVTVGHKVMLHGCAIEDRCLIGMSTTILDKVLVEPQVVIGAGSLVPPGKVLESGYLYVGAPAKRVRRLRDDELSFLDYAAEYYAKLKEKHKPGN